MIRDYELGEWVPDLADINNTNMSVCENLIPTVDGYKTHPGPITITNDELGAPYHNTAWYLLLDGRRRNIVGGEKGVWTFDRFNRYFVRGGTDAGWQPASSWEFARFKDLIVCVSPENQMFYQTLANGYVGDVISTAPRAKRVSVVGNHLVVGDTTKLDGTLDGTVGRNYVQWCGNRNINIWGSNRSLLSDFQPLEGRGGRVHKILGGTVGFIFQEKAIRVMTPVPQKAFKFQVLKTESGTDAPDSVVKYGDTIFYYGWGDFYALNSKTGQSENISKGKISEWFKKDSDVSGLASMKGVVDFRNRNIMWAYSTRAPNQSGGYPYNDSILYFSIDTGKWSVVRTKTRLLFEYYEEGYTLDELDSVLLGGADFSGDWVADDPWLEGDYLSINAFNENDLFTSFAGPAMQFQIETGDISNGTNKRLYTNAIEPLLEGVSDENEVFAQIGVRNKLSDQVKWGRIAQVNTRNDRACVKANSKYQRFRLVGSASFAHSKAIRLYGHSLGGING